jgi:hypothetical protein
MGDNYGAHCANAQSRRWKYGVVEGLTKSEESALFSRMEEEGLSGLLHQQID